jgi:2,3,4,5-tetrahydropyridine-2-carboxylate N-succinyltransferase
VFIKRGVIVAMSDEAALAQFAERLNERTKPCPTVGVIKVSLNGRLLRVVANQPGQSGSLRVLANFQRQGKLDRAGVAECLDVFAPLVPHARQNPGAHPNIDLLLSVGEGQSLDLELIETPPDLFSKLADGTASVEQKQAAVNLLDRGLVRCAEKLADYTVGGAGIVLGEGGTWVTQSYGIACMNAGFSAFPMTRIGEHYYDKVPLKTQGWSERDFEAAGVRFIPGCFARKGAYIGSGTTIMPGGIVNIGAYVAGAGVMIDGGARVATGAQVGKAVKLGAGSGIEGILEPAGRLPTIVEDNVRIGANCELSGIIEQGAVIASGVIMASGKKIFDLRTNQLVEPRYMAIGDKYYEIPVIPANRVAVGGVYSKTDKLGVDCIVLLEKDAADTSLAQLPRNAELYVRL